MTQEIEFYTPLLIAIKVEEADNRVELLEAWKREFLTGWYLEIWEKAKSPEKPVAGIKKALAVIKFIIRYFAPIITLAITAYFGVLSAIFLAIVLLPIQGIIVIFLLGKAYSLACVIGAEQLEKQIATGS